MSDIEKRWGEVRWGDSARKAPLGASKKQGCCWRRLLSTLSKARPTMAILGKAEPNLLSWHDSSILGTPSFYLVAVCHDNCCNTIHNAETVLESSSPPLCVTALPLFAQGTHATSIQCWVQPLQKGELFALNAISFSSSLGLKRHRSTSPASMNNFGPEYLNSFPFRR